MQLIFENKEKAVVLFGIIIFLAVIYIYLKHKRYVHRYEQLDDLEEQKSSNINYDINTKGGNYKGSYIQGDYYAAGKPQSLVQAAGEIQALLKQLENSYPSDIPARNMVVATEVVKHLETNPTMKQKVINAVKEGGLAAFERIAAVPTFNVPVR